MPSQDIQQNTSGQPRHWLARLVRYLSRWEVSKWTNDRGSRYITRRQKKTGEIQVKHLNFFWGDGGRKWHAFDTGRSWEQEDVLKFYQSNTERTRAGGVE